MKFLPIPLFKPISFIWLENIKDPYINDSILIQDEKFH